MPGSHDDSDPTRGHDVEPSRATESGPDADRTTKPPHRQVRELECENERLAELLDVLGHDLRNHLAVAMGRLEVARGESDDENLEAVARSHERMEELLDDLLAARDEGFAVGDAEPVSLETCARRAWETVDSGDVDLVVESNREVLADRTRLTQLLENLFCNSVEHGSTSPRSKAHEDATERGIPDARSTVTVTVGASPGGSGFFVEDDGRGLPPADRERLFEGGFSTAEGGTGLGLSIVRDVARGHGWTVDATESAAGGARFEISGVDRPALLSDGQRSR